MQYGRRMTPDPERFATLERALTRLVRRTLLPTAGEATRRDAGVDLERSAYITLARIAALEGPRLTELAAALGLEVSTTSRHVKRLKADGLVTVEIDPDDSRARRFTPSPAGQDALDRVRHARRSRLARMLHDWNPDEVAALANGLDRLVTAFEDDERAHT